MGKHQLRKQASEALGRRLYKGKEGQGTFSAEYLRTLIKEARLRVGDIVHDCDGFNHRIAKKTLVTDQAHGFAWVRYIEFEKENGDGFCGCCSVANNPAVPWEDVEGFMRAWYNAPDMVDWVEGDPCSVKRKEAMNAGLRITDDAGLLLPEYS